jgi:ABC-type multidrug transport system ATPase subunit
MIEINNLSLKYTKEIYALNNISLKVNDKETVFIVGEDSSGKTTLLRILAKLENDYEGDIYIKNIDLKKIDFSCDLSIGYLPNTSVFLENKSVFDNMMYALRIRDTKSSQFDAQNKIDKILTDLKIMDLRDKQPKILSNYNRYLVSLARLLLRDEELVLIDNFMDGLKKEEQDDFLALIKEYFIDKNVTLLIASNSEDFAKRLNARVYKLSYGTLV